MREDYHTTLSRKPYFSPCMARRIIEILLAVVILYMGYRLYDSIREPVQWQNEKAKRYTAIKKELLAVRDAQIVYKGEHGHYAKNFVELRYFLAKGKIKKYAKNIPAKAKTVPFTLVSPADSVFGKGYDVYGLGFVPFNKARQTFSINIITTNGIEYMEVADPDPFDPDEPLSIGSTVEPTLRASWENK